MEIFNNNGNSTHRSKSKCSYCRAEGHNATHCPRVDEDYVYFKSTPPVIPVGISTTLNTCHWYAFPRYWGDWYDKCINAFSKQQAAKMKASSSPTRSARAKPKCGFCGDETHNRRNCTAMDRYWLTALKANQNWRRAFYEKFVVEMGISEGALLNLKERQGLYSNEDDVESIGIVTDVNWNELSLFCSSTAKRGAYCQRNDNYIQRLQVTVQINKETKVISFGRNEGIDIIIQRGFSKTKNLVKYSGTRYHWDAPEFVSVLSPSITPLGEEWIVEGHRKSLEFLTKKRSKAKLDEEDVTALINHWL
jgi:hypothetical protein